jgi:hypothetical protein
VLCPSTPCPVDDEACCRLRFSDELERRPLPPAQSMSAAGTSGDYAWMLVFGALFTGLVKGLFLLAAHYGFPSYMAQWGVGPGSMTGETLLAMVIFVWSRQYKESSAGVWSECRGEREPTRWQLMLAQ